MYKIPNYINIRKFNTRKNKSIVFFVEDVKNHIFYILKNELAKKLEKAKDKEKFLFEIKDLKCAISTENKNFHYFRAKLGDFFYDNNILSSITLELNYKCNLNCRHCYNPKNMDDYSISFEQAKKIIDDAYYGNVYGITLTGGECTINNDFLKIATYVRKKHMPLFMLTNCQKFYDDETLFKQIANLYPSIIKISLYSMSSNLHNFVTNDYSSHNKSINIIKKFCEKNLKVEISTLQLSYNTGEYKEVKKFADTIKADFSTNCNFICNKNNNNLNAKCSFEDIEQFYCSTLDMNNIRNFQKSDDEICKAGKTRLSIRPNLDITPCVGFNHVLGNYNSTSLKELQETILPKFREKFIKSNLKECFKHYYCRFCQYCSLQSTHETGFLKKSPTLCEDAKAYYKAYLKHNQLQK